MVLNTFRMVGGSIGAFISMTFTLPLVKLLGGDDPQKGFSLTVGMFGIIVIILLVFAFRHLKEQNVEANKAIPVKDSLRAVAGNWPWILLVTANLLVWIDISMRQGTVIYYCKYVLGDEDLASVLNGILNLACLSSFFTMAFIVKVTRKYGAMLLGALLVIIGHSGIYLSGSSTAMIIVFWILAGFGQGLICAMPFGMLADTVDYGEWKTGIRASGFLTAIGAALCIKAGSGVGAFIPTLILDNFGYIANQEQTAQALYGIELSFIWLPCIVAALAAVPMVIYRRYELMEKDIVAELKERAA